LASAVMVSSYTVALFFHILGVLVFVSGIVLAAAALEVARRREEPAQIALVLGLARIGATLVGPGFLIVLGFGLWLVELGGFGFGTGWIDAALALFALAFVLGAAGGRRPRRARVLAAQLAEQGAPASPQLRALLDDRVSLAVNYASALIVLVILALMVFKP
ncbi:MAG TPA: DUF2269 family protein, partial [Solirubrobacteraceae bacterium]|nr:DUF2269 family protein [Solirubrobacteraceae bacterium]